MNSWKLCGWQHDRVTEYRYGVAAKGEPSTVYRTKHFDSMEQARQYVCAKLFGEEDLQSMNDTSWERKLRPVDNLYIPR